MSVGGEVRVPRRRLGSEEEAVLFATVSNQRMASGDPDWNTDRAYERVHIMGKTWTGHDSNQPIALAETLDAPVVMNLTYNEGGNALVGKKENGEPFVLIGKDAHRFSKRLLRKDLGREVTDAEVTKAFAIDYGVKMENVHFVEQPGNFHLDLGMLLIEPNTIILNDAEKSFTHLIWPDLRPELIGQNLNSDAIELVKKDQLKQVKRKKTFEDKAAKDLEDQGFNVIRVGGNGEPYKNLFNCITATTPNGEKLMVTGDPGKEGQPAFDKIKEQFPEMKIEFLDGKKFSQLLRAHGGIHCTTKTITKTCVET